MDIKGMTEQERRKFNKELNDAIDKLAGLKYDLPPYGNGKKVANLLHNRVLELRRLQTYLDLGIDTKKIQKVAV